jgi:hypothetical protein
MHTDLQPGESDLIGQWLDLGSRIEGDAMTARIQWLIAERLERLSDDSGGWEVLYRDPRDGRLWELTYPHGQMHGGGPPRLHLLSPEQASAKYRLGDA